MHKYVFLIELKGERVLNSLLCLLVSYEILIILFFCLVNTLLVVLCKFEKKKTTSKSVGQILKSVSVFENMLLMLVMFIADEQLIITKLQTRIFKVTLYHCPPHVRL